MKTSLKQKLKKALEIDNTLMIKPVDIGSAIGFSLDHLEYCGLSKNDLKKLEIAGIAIRGRLPLAPNSLKKLKTLANTKNKAQYYPHVNRWILIEQESLWQADEK